MAQGGPSVRVMLTGFGPFGKWNRNSSGEAIRLIGQRRPDIAAEILPVDHVGAVERLQDRVALHRPDVLLLTGLADGAAMRIETLARPLGGIGLGVRPARWHLGAALRALRSRNLPARFSSDAGGYVCDTTFFAALHLVAGPCLFLHVPPLSQTWPVERIARGIEAVADTADSSLQQWRASRRSASKPRGN